MLERASERTPMGDWWDDGAGGVRKGLALYSKRTDQQLEETFDEMSSRVRHRDPLYLDNEDLAVAAEFKVWGGLRRRAHSRAMAAASVEATTKDALALAEQGKHEDALRLLTTLPGVAAPTASAILAAAMPDSYGIIDRFCMGEIGYLVVTRLRDEPRPDSALQRLADALPEWAQGSAVNTYRPYTEGLRQRAADTGFAVRQVEMALSGQARR